jgi:hypothetical protein
MNTGLAGARAPPVHARERPRCWTWLSCGQMDVLVFLSRLPVLGDKLLQWRYLGKVDVRVRCHEAQLLTPYVAGAVFINVTNLSPKRPVKPTHVMVMTTPPVAVVNPLRPLRTLAADGDSWETWIEKASLPDPKQDVRGLVEVRLSNGETIQSTPVTAGVDLPGAGQVPQ